MVKMFAKAYSFSLTITTIFVGLLGCYLHYYLTIDNNKEFLEPMQIALETSGELLPPDSLVQRIKKDLKEIRLQFPEVAEIVHTPKWEVGKVVFYNENAKMESIEKINTSRFGRAEICQFYEDPIFSVTFQKPYNPEKLGELLKQELGIEGAEPAEVFGRSSSITLTTEPSGKHTYMFFKGSGDCYKGCRKKTFWKITAGPGESSVQLVDRIFMTII